MRWQFSAILRFVERVASAVPLGSLNPNLAAGLLELLDVALMAQAADARSAGVTAGSVCATTSCQPCKGSGAAVAGAGSTGLRPRHHSRIRIWIVAAAGMASGGGGTPSRVAPA